MLGIERGRLGFAGMMEKGREQGGEKDEGFVESRHNHAHEANREI
jgi:hypothetical protein